jgi:ubiquinone/menaquinone biosynthesis C-methylase UbiE
VTSYEAARENADLDAEVERLRAQVALTFTQEFRALGHLGLRDGMVVADFGSGPGFALDHFLQLLPNSRIIGIEIDPTLHSRAEGRLAAHPRLTLLNRSASDSGLQGSTVDFVIARFLYQHLEDPNSATKEALRILKPGGRLVVIDVDESVWGLTDPPIPALQRVMARYAAAHARDGRDRRVGRKLWRILRANGFQDLEAAVAIAHSDEVGLNAFRAQLDLGRLKSLVGSGELSTAELDSARQARDGFLSSTDSIMMTLTLLVSGQKPPA